MSNTLQIPKTGAVSWEQVNSLLSSLMAEGKLQQARAWNMSALQYVKGDRIKVQKNCFAFMFTNIGDTVALVNDMIIFPNATPLTAVGDSRSVAGHWLDLYKGKLLLAFQAPIGGAPKVEIVQLFYLEGND